MRRRDMAKECVVEEYVKSEWCHHRCAGVVNPKSGIPALSTVANNVFMKTIYKNKRGGKQNRAMIIKSW